MAEIYLLKDLARLSGQSIHTVKYYLKIGLIHEVGRSPETHFRYFNGETLAALEQIRRWRREGRSLKEIRQRMGAGQRERSRGTGGTRGGAP